MVAPVGGIVTGGGGTRRHRLEGMAQSWVVEVSLHSLAGLVSKSAILGHRLTLRQMAASGLCTTGC